MSEISLENLGPLDRRYRLTVYVVLAQIFIVLILMAIALLDAPRIETVEVPQDFTSAWIALLFLAVGSFLLRRVLFNWERLKNTAVLKGVAGVLRTLQLSAILLSLVGFGIAVLGFVIALFSGSGFDMVRAGLVALIVLIINFPRKRLWKAIVTQLEKV